MSAGARSGAAPKDSHARGARVGPGDCLRKVAGREHEGRRSPPQAAVAAVQAQQILPVRSAHVARQAGDVTELNQPQPTAGHAPCCMRQHVDHQRGSAGIDVDAGVGMRREDDVRQVSQGERQAFADTVVQVDLDGIVGVLAEPRGGSPPGWLEALMLPGRSGVE